MYLNGDLSETQQLHPVKLILKHIHPFFYYENYFNKNNPFLSIAY